MTRDDSWRTYSYFKLILMNKIWKCLTVSNDRSKLFVLNNITYNPDVPLPFEEQSWKRFFKHSERSVSSFALKGVWSTQIRTESAFLECFVQLFQRSKSVRLAFWGFLKNLGLSFQMLIKSICKTFNQHFKSASLGFQWHSLWIRKALPKRSMNAL